MKVIRAKVLGFCMGVRRAVNMAEAEARTAAGVKTIGALIHNPQALESLCKKGISLLDEASIPPDLKDTPVIIRAHGIPPQLEQKLRVRGARLVDATCPKVKASQMKVRNLSESGYRIFLAGEAHHGEIIGILGYAPLCITAADAAEAACAAEKLYREDPLARTALLGQTTISPGEYGAIEEAIKRFFPGLITEDTICGATRDRQNSLRELCSLVDAVLIAGGRESANTRRLLMIAENLGKPAWLIETAAEIPPGVYRYGTLGLSAGASTPDEVIDAIETELLLHSSKQ